MLISKSMFKNLVRCPNFAALYDMYIYRAMNHVKRIDGIDVQDVMNMPGGAFEDESEEVREIFGQMFDEESGDDLTVVSDAQMEAMQEYYTATEMVAGQEISSLFGSEVHYSQNTRDQKQFSFSDEENSYYCYLDGYLENSEGIHIFEVKATTSTKFIRLGKALRHEDEEGCSTETAKEDMYESIFVRGPKGIMYLREDLDQNVETEHLSLKEYQKYREKLFDRYGNDGTGKYVFDLAVERYFIEHSLMDSGEEEKISQIKYYLAVLTGDYVFDGTYDHDVPQYHKDANGRSIVTLIDLTTVTKEYQPLIGNLKHNVEQYLRDLSVNDHQLGVHCDFKKSTQCKFKPVCFRKVSSPGSIMEFMGRSRAFSLPSVANPRKREYFTVYELMNRGMNLITDVPAEYLTHDENRIQRECFLEHSIYMEKAKIRSVLDDLKYPLFHLDFESFGCPLPRFRGEKPYSQSLFQFSLHVEKERGRCNKTTDHYDFLAKDHHDHREELVRSLVELIDLSHGGTVIVYNETFEKTRLKELALLYPPYAKKLLDIRDHVFDLLQVLKGNKKMFLPYADAGQDPDEAAEWAGQINYYHNEMHGSYSIKKILPLFSDLSYKTLDVRNGTEAVLVYSQLPNLTETEYNQKYLSLRKYCQQDTWAMVEILWGLWKAVTVKTAVEAYP